MELGDAIRDQNSSLLSQGMAVEKQLFELSGLFWVMC